MHLNCNNGYLLIRFLATTAIHIESTVVAPHLCYKGSVLYKKHSYHLCLEPHINMAYLDQMEWKGCISAAFERGGTFSAAHRDFLPGTTWTQLPLADHPYEVLNILTPCEDTDVVTIDSSIVGVISATEVTMHWTGERLHPSDALCACYLKIVVRSPKNDDGQFGRSIQNLRNLTTSLRHTGLSGHPFPLITEDGNGILLYHRLFDTDNVSNLHYL